MNANSNSPMSILSALSSTVGALLLLSVLVGAWNYSVGGTALMAGGALGLVGAATGWLARKAGRNSLNAFGFWLGLGVVALTAVTVLWLTPTEVTTLQG